MKKLNHIYRDFLTSDNVRVQLSNSGMFKECVNIEPEYRDGDLLPKEDRKYWLDKTFDKYPYERVFFAFAVAFYLDIMHKNVFFFEHQVPVANEYIEDYEKGYVEI